MSFSQLWKNAAAPQDEIDPPDGTYRVEVYAADAFQGNDGRQWAKLTLGVLEAIGELDQDPVVGRQFVHFMNLNNDVGVRVARDALFVYGLDLERVGDFEDLAAQIVELIGVRAEVGVTHNNGYVRIKVVSATDRGATDVPAPPIDPPPPAAPDDDDIPF